MPPGILEAWRATWIIGEPGGYGHQTACRRRRIEVPRYRSRRLTNLGGDAGGLALGDGEALAQGRLDPGRIGLSVERGALAAAEEAAQKDLGGAVAGADEGPEAA